MTNDSPPPVHVRLANVLHWIGRVVVVGQLAYIVGPPLFGHRVNGDVLAVQLGLVAVTVGVYSALDYLITGQRRI
jgi:hypothetical protein